MHIRGSQNSTPLVFDSEYKMSHFPSRAPAYMQKLIENVCTSECLQHLLIRLSTAKHDRALGYHTLHTLLGLLQHRQTLLVASPGVTDQPGATRAGMSTKMG